MSGCLDNFRLPECDCSAHSGRCLVSIGWWIMIDAAAGYPSPVGDASRGAHVRSPGYCSGVHVNSISNGQVTGSDTYTDGCFGQNAARLWLFLGFILAFGSLIASVWILFGVYVGPQKSPMWPGLPSSCRMASFFAGNMIFKFGRSRGVGGTTNWIRSTQLCTALKI
uniref:Transmembrane protein 144 n=1 Tax=Macrostomum lignano TaxID=282301 RepID=A0A1I8FP20_9PLAT